MCRFKRLLFFLVSQPPFAKIIDFCIPMEFNYSKPIIDRRRMLRELTFCRRDQFNSRPFDLCMPRKKWNILKECISVLSHGFYFVLVDNRQLVSNGPRYVPASAPAARKELGDAIVGRCKRAGRDLVARHWPLYNVPNPSRGFRLYESRGKGYTLLVHILIGLCAPRAIFVLSPGRSCARTFYVVCFWKTKYKNKLLCHRE